MHARLETKRILGAAVAAVYAIVAVLIFSAGGGHAIGSPSAPAEHRAPVAGRQAAQGGPQSDLTRALPGQQGGGGDTNFDTCTRLVHETC